MSDLTQDGGRKRTLFTGAQERVVDSKGRFNLPARFRSGGASVEDEKYVVTIASPKSLALYTREEWDASFAATLLQGGDEQWRDQIRRLSAQSQDVVPDQQGRVTVPVEILKKVGISERIVLVGMGQYLELWDKQSYGETNPAQEAPAKDFMDTFLRFRR
jgi:MraZ protein